MPPTCCTDRPRLPHKDARTSRTRLHKSIILPLLFAALTTSGCARDEAVTCLTHKVSNGELTECQ